MADEENDLLCEKRRLGYCRDQIYEVLLDALAIAEKDHVHFRAYSSRQKHHKTRRIHPNTVLGRARRKLRAYVLSNNFLLMLKALGWADPRACADMILNKFAKGEDLDRLKELLKKYRSLKQGHAGKPLRRKNDQGISQESQGNCPGATTGIDGLAGDSG